MKKEIEFFKEGKSLGKFPLRDYTDEPERYNIAVTNSISGFDQYKLLADDNVTYDTAKPKRYNSGESVNQKFYDNNNIPVRLMEERELA